MLLLNNDFTQFSTILSVVFVTFINLMLVWKYKKEGREDKDPLYLSIFGLLILIFIIFVP